MANKVQTTKREFSTQCPRPDLFIDDRGTLEVKPKKYFDSILWLERRKLAALFV